MTPQHMQWLHVGLFVGILILGLTQWALYRGYLASGGRWHRWLQFFGIMLTVLPAVVEWYFSQSLIMLVAMLMFTYGGYRWLKQQGGK